MTHSLISAYRRLHQKGLFPGYSIESYVPRIAEIIRSTGALSLLDYGSGEGKQYTIKRVHDAWGGLLPTLYDPAVPGLDKRPVGKFDGVLCTDVLEHVPEHELEGVIADLIRYARMWCFISVCCRPAKPNKDLWLGKNAHVTLHDQTWWFERLGSQWPESGLELYLSFTP
jgi:hypothetical protein